MSRDKNGRFTDCGNPKGRPKVFAQMPRPISHQTERDDFFEVDNASVTITENGKRKDISVRKAIYHKLAYNAASGDTRAAIEWNKIRNRFVAAFLDEQIELMKSVHESEKFVQNSPEDVTDSYLEVLKQARAMLSPGFNV